MSGNIAERIDALLKERGITGAKMSTDLGMSRSFMTELRKGRAKGVTADTAARIAKYLGVSTDYLLLRGVLGHGEEHALVGTRAQLLEISCQFPLHGVVEAAVGVLAEQIVG